MAYPVKTRKLKRTSATLWLLWAVNDKGQVWLQKRPEKGIWAGLFSLPVFDSEAQLLAALDGETLHQWLGYAAAALVGVRAVWGFVGPRHARFVDFFPTPKRLAQHVQALRRGEVEHHWGHNPLGALSVLALIGVLAAQVATGLVGNDEIAFTGPLVSLVSGDTVSQATRYHKSVGKLILIALVGVAALLLQLTGLFLLLFAAIVTSWVRPSGVVIVTTMSCVAVPSLDTTVSVSVTWVPAGRAWTEALVLSNA